MDFGHIAELAGEDEYEIIAIAESLADVDIRITILYREYLLVRLLVFRDTTNTRLQRYLSKLYWKLINEVNLLNLIIGILGFKVLTLTGELTISHHHN